MKSFPYYTLDGLTQLGDALIDTTKIATIRCLDARPTMAQVYMKQQFISPLWLMKDAILDHLMPITFDLKLERGFFAAIASPESEVGDVTLSGGRIHMATDEGVDASYSRDLTALGCTSGKLQRIILSAIGWTGDGLLTISIGANEVTYTPAQMAALLLIDTGTNDLIMMDDTTDTLTISLTGSTVPSELSFSTLYLSQRVQTPLASLNIVTSNGLTALGTVHIGPEYGDGTIYPPSVAEVKTKIDDTVSQVFFVDGALQGVYVDKTELETYLWTITTIE